MVRLKYEDNSGLLLYVLLLDDNGDNVWDTNTSAWVDVYDEDNPSLSADPWIYAIALTESLAIPGFYYADVDLSTAVEGWVRFSVYEQDGSDEQETDNRIASARFYVVDGEEYEYEGLAADIAAARTAASSGTAKLSKQDRRAIARAGNKSKRRGR